MGEKKFTFLRLKKEKGYIVRKELTKILKKQREVKTKIFSSLKSGPKTIPEIASETGLELHIITWYLMTYWKSRIVEACDKNDEGFWKYSLIKGGG